MNTNSSKELGHIRIKDSNNNLFSKLQNIILNNKIGLAYFFSGYLVSYLFQKIKKIYQIKKITETKTSDILNKLDEDPHKKNNENTEKELIREQLKRNYEFFGEIGMEKIRNSFIVVVGIGGVGSHVLMTLVRSGVKKIRVIDYDSVTLSSLNRHAFAFRNDVGKLKVRVVKEYAIKINPSIIIEQVDDAFVKEYSEKYILEGSPDYVIDCIDDLDAKCELLEFCERKNLRVISSMGAGGKMDPSCIRFSDFNSIKGERLAKRLRVMYKKKFSKVIPNIKCVYSIENSKGLTDLEEHQKGNPEDFRVNENERIRSLPVFASIPAIFGQALASVILCDLAEMKMSSLDEIDNKAALVDYEKEKIGNVLISKLVEDFKKDELKKNNTKDIDLTYDDFIRIADEFNRKSSLSQTPGFKIRFVRWAIFKPIARNNIVLLSKEEINRHKGFNTFSDLIEKYGKETCERIEKSLKNLEEK